MELPQAMGREMFQVSKVFDLELRGLSLILAHVVTHIR